MRIHRPALGYVAYQEEEVTFISALEQFRIELIKQYGVSDPIIKIGIDRGLYIQIMCEMKETERYFTIDSACEPEVIGIKIVPREKDTF